MPENHERNKEKTEPAYRRECGSAEYELRAVFESDRLRSGCHCLGAATEVASGISADISNRELLNNTPKAKQIATNSTHDRLDLKKDESCSHKDSRSLKHGEEVLNQESVCVNKTLSGEEEIEQRIHSVASVQKRLSRREFFAKEDSERTQFENGFPTTSVSFAIERQRIAVIGQEASKIASDTVRLMNEVLNLESEPTELCRRDRSDTEKAELDTATDAACGKEDSPPKVQRGTGSERRTAEDAGEINPVLHDAPLIYPETSNIALSISSASSAKKEKSPSSRTTPCLRHVESGAGSDNKEKKETDLNESRDGNPSESNLADEDIQQQFHIIVKTHPDGGWGWVVCFGAFLVQFIALGMLNSAGIVYTELVKELKTQRGATAWVGSLATGIMFFLGPLTTSLCEKLGCRIVTICGGLICIAGLLLSSMATSLLPFYLTYGLMFGSGTSLCYFPTIIVLSKYFKKRIAVVNGLVTSGSGVGTLVISPVVQALFLRFGVANTFRIVAGIYSVILLCGATFRPVPTKYSQYNNRTEGEGARGLFDWSIFKNKGYLIWIASLATFQLGYFVPFVHLVRHAEDLGVTPTDASFLIGYLSVASTVGRLFFGKMADLSCVNRIRMYQLGVFAIGLCSFLVPLATGYGGLTAYAIGFGFFEACFVLLIPLVTTDIVGTEKMSYALGSAFTVMAFPMFLGPPIAGWMYDIFGDYAGAFYSCGGTSLTSASLMFFVPRLSSKTKEESNQKLRKLLTRNNHRNHPEFQRILFGCLWKKELHESKTSVSNVHYSVIITTEGLDGV